MKKLNRTNFNSNRYPERVIQFGEGNFLRAFVDWMIDHANQAGIFQGSVVVVQPIAQGLADKINEQDGLFTVVTRGLQNGKPVVKRNLVSSISRALNAVSEWEQVLACAADQISISWFLTLPKRALLMFPQIVWNKPRPALSRARSALTSITATKPLLVLKTRVC